MNRIWTVCIFMTLICVNTVFAQKASLHSVKIEWESFSTESFRDVSCDDFEYSFLDTRKYCVISKKPELTRLSSLRISKFFKTEKEFKSIDVRGKIIFSYSNSTVKYCFDQFGHFCYRGALFNNKSLWAFIINTIPKADQ